MRSPPRFTIVTPSFNQEAFLERTLDSVRAQRFPDVEHFVVDGGSADRSREILLERQGELAWWCSEADRGQTDAINKGLRRATGDILAWLNSDDVYCPGALSKVAAFFAAHPDCDAVVGDLEIIDASDRLLDVKKSVPVTWRRNLFSGCAIPQPATFFTRRAYELTGELDDSLHYQMDYEFFLRMQASGVKFGIIREPLARFRLHGDSKTVSEYRRKFWRDFGSIQDRYLPFAPGGAWREPYRQLMKWLYRADMYAARAITRGVVLPFRNTRVRQQIGP